MRLLIGGILVIVLVIAGLGIFLISGPPDPLDDTCKAIIDDPTTLPKYAQAINSSLPESDQSKTNDVATRLEIDRKCGEDPTQTMRQIRETMIHEDEANKAAGD